MENIAIKTSNLTKDFQNTRAVDNLNLEISEGEFFGFLGPNGAGKTTSMRMMTGRLRPTFGDATVCGYSITKETLKVKERIGVLEDEPKLFERLTVEEFLDFIGDIYDVKESNREINRLIDFVDLEEKKNSLIIDLSHGMRKKVGLIAELLHKPEVLFLDEPFAGIDPVSSKAIKDALKEMTEKGVTIFLSTHILEVAEKLCERVAIIDKGKVIADGGVQELKKEAELKDKSTLEDIFLKLVKESEKVEI